MFVMEKTFTILDWLIIEKALEGNLDFRDIDDFQKIQLASNILPEGHGILHKLASDTRKSQKN